MRRGAALQGPVGPTYLPSRSYRMTWLMMLIPEGERRVPRTRQKARGWRTMAGGMDGAHSETEEMMADVPESEGQEQRRKKKRGKQHSTGARKWARRGASQARGDRDQ